MTYDVAVRNSEAFGKQLWSLKNQKMLCDASLIVNGERIAVHAVVLASSSVYFKHIFGESALKEVSFKEVSKEAMLSLIEFCYTGRIKITEKNTNEIFDLANVLSIMTVFESFSPTLERKLNISNCLNTWKIARMGNLEHLKNLATACIRKNFETVSQTERFLDLDYSEVHTLLNSDLSFVSDMVIYNAVKNWINRDIDSRKVHLDELLNFVSFKCLPREFLISESLSMCDLNISCFKKFNEAINWLRERSFLKCKGKTLIAVGANNNQITKIVEIYDTMNEKWIEKDIGCEKKETSAIIFKDKLMIIGGILNNKSVNTVECYNLESGKMESTPPMKYSRFKLSTVEYEGNIFAIGGRDFTQVFDKVEKWDPELKTWTDVASLNLARWVCRAVVLNNEIFVVGGYTSESIDSVEAYSSTRNKWRNCRSMNYKRHGFGLVASGGYLYAVGGNNSNTAERYDPKSDNWTVIRQPGINRTHLAAGILVGCLVVAGGHALNKSSNSVEVYDIEKGEWKSMTSLKNPREVFDLLEISWGSAENLLSWKK